MIKDSHGYGGFTMEIPIFKKTYELFREFYAFQLDFPKKDRYTLGQRCETYILEILEGIISAGQLPKEKKLAVLERASNKLDMLKVFTRLAADLNILSEKRYIVCQSYMQEIGKMLGGWIKASRDF